MHPFVRGQVYLRRDLHRAYGGNPRSGISSTAKHPFIFLFKTVPGRQIYHDRREPDGTILYSGAGLRGPMVLRGGNLMVAEHRAKGKSLLVFEETEKRRGSYTFEGEYLCTSVFAERQPDVTGALREALVFRLTPLEAAQERVVDGDLPSADLSEEEILRRAQQRGSYEPNARTALVKYWERAAAVKEYALKWARGICQGCGLAAPFSDKRGRPFLEVHHIRGLAEGGADCPEDVIAICPNCHRRVHYGADGEEVNARVVARLREHHGNAAGLGNRRRRTSGPLPTR